MVNQQSSKMLVAWNTTAQVIGKCITGAVTFFFSLIIARSYGAVGYGDFTKITTFVAFFYLLSDFGLNAIYLQKHKSESPFSWNVLFGLRLVGSAMLVFFAVSLLAFLPHGTNQGYTNLVRLGIIFFVPSIVFQSIITTTNAIFQKHLRYDLSTVSIVAGSVLSLILLLVFSFVLSVQVGALASILALLLGSLASSVVALFFVKKLGTPLSPVFEFKPLTDLFVASIPLGLTLLCNVVYFRVDSVILTITRSTAEVGLYGFAYKLFELPLVIPTFFLNAVYPLLLIASPDRFVTLLKKSFVLLLVSSLLLLLLCWFFSPLVVLIRPEFSGSIVALKILSLGIPFFFLSSLVMWALIAKGKQMLLLVLYSLSMILTTILDLVFIPSGGLVTASWITVISELFVLIVSSVTLFLSTKRKGTI